MAAVGRFETLPWLEARSPTCGLAQIPPADLDMSHPRSTGGGAVSALLCSQIGSAELRKPRRSVQGWAAPAVGVETPAAGSLARGRTWFDELVTGRALSLQALAERDGITRRYIRRLVGLAFLSPELVDAILQGRQPVALTTTRLTELDLPLDWADQHRLLTA